MKNQKEAEWIVELKKVFPVFLMLAYAVGYIIAVTLQFENGQPKWTDFLVYAVMLGSQIGRASIKNNKIVVGILTGVFFLLLLVVGLGVAFGADILIQVALYVNLIAFCCYDALDMLRAGVRGTIDELENTNIPECNCQSRCLKLGERELCSKMCSSKEHTEQHVHKNIKNTFFNIIIQRPIQITKEQEENEDTLLQKNELSKEKTNEQKTDY